MYPASPAMDLAVLPSLIQARRNGWPESVAVDIEDGLPDVYRVRCESEDVVAELLARSSGLVDLIVGDLRTGESATDHYEVTSVIGLSGCLDDLERAVGAAG